MLVTLLKPANAMQYRTLMLEAYELAADAFTTTAEERAAEPDTFWIKRVSSSAGQSAAFGVYIEQTLVGTVALEFSRKTKTKHKALVISMYVAPAARGAGAGRALMNAVINYALAKEEILVLNLTVTEGNEAAINLYRSMGFQEVGVEPMAIFTPSGYKGKVHMWLPLQRGAQSGALEV